MDRKASRSYSWYSLRCGGIAFCLLSGCWFGLSCIYCGWAATPIEHSDPVESAWFVWYSNLWGIVCLLSFVAAGAIFTQVARGFWRDCESRQG